MSIPTIEDAYKAAVPKGKFPIGAGVVVMALADFT